MLVNKYFNVLHLILLLSIQKEKFTKFFLGFLYNKYTFIFLNNVAFP